MKGIVLVSHGQLAAGMYDTLKLFVGEPEQVKSVCLSPGQEMPDFLNQLMSSISEVDSGEGVIVFCDLLFGTPCNCSASLLNNEKLAEKIEVITGMNLPMILEYVGNRLTNMDNKTILDTGKEGIVDFKEMYKERMNQSN